MEKSALQIRIITIVLALLMAITAVPAWAQEGSAVVAWGDNFYGQATVPGDLSGVMAVAAGSLHSLALKSDGTVVAWGNNYFGQATVPAELSDVTGVAAGYAHSLALKSDGTVVAWGLNTDGQATVPGDLSGVMAVAAGDLHSLALKSDGTVVAWGDDFYGQATVPGDLSGVTSISAGGAHNLALHGSMANSFIIKAEPVCCTAMEEGAICYQVKITVATNYYIMETIKVQGGTAAWVEIYYSDFEQAENKNGLLPAKQGCIKNKTVILGDNLEGLAAGEFREYVLIVCGIPSEDEICPNVLGGFTASYEYFDEELGQPVEVNAVCRIEGTDFYETPPVLSCHFEECAETEQ